MRVLATVGNTTWETAIFPSKQFGAYILPIKADARKKEKILVEIEVRVTLKTDV